MPCYLRGTLRLTNFDRLQQTAIGMGLTITKRGEEITVLKNGKVVTTTTEKELMKGGNTFMKEVVKSYAINQVKMAAQKKGWKISNTKEENGKITMRLRE